MVEENISAAFPFKSKFAEINDSKMHYIDEGKGDPMLFIHGQPTSSYLWRNVIPHLKTKARCIALDLIGMGKSDKPDIEYTFEDHYDYLEKFIQKLKLKNVTLVIHDWGSGLGFHYANKHRDNIKGIAFMESVYRPFTWDDFPGSFRILFTMFRTRFIGWLMITVGNMFLTKLLPNFMMRKLTKEEIEYYNAPYPTRSSRKPVRMWPLQLPINGKPKRVHDKVASYN
ncbi:MAG: haloalkane dehalogenase, partial [Nitrososphaerales archaeon]